MLYKHNQSGQVLILAIVVTALVLINILAIISGAQLFYQNTNYTNQSAVAVNLAEAGVDKALASLNKTGGSYAGEVETSLGTGSYSVSMTNLNASTKVIEATGYIPNKTYAKIKKTIKVQISSGTGISFVYGLLVGSGGLSMGNGSVINGSVYSNGNILGGNNEHITGDVYVAGGTQAIANQQSDCSDVGCTDFIFGKNVAGKDRLDVAQSFKPSNTLVLNKVSLKLKKIGLPSNPIVRIMKDSGGKPDKNNILVSKTLSANLITNQYGFVDVDFSSSPTLTAETTYWIMIEAQSIDNSNYWAWSEDTSQGYTRGSPVWSVNWQAQNPIWTNITGDLGFKTWMGGETTSITMSNGSKVDGNVHANTISGITVGKDAYYKVIEDSHVNGASHPDSDDPAPISMPISEANITAWENDATGLHITTGNISGCPSLIGPGKIIGNITTSNNCNVTVKTPIWLTGNLTFGNSTIFRMDPSSGAYSGVIIVNGKTTFTNSDNLLGTGAQGSYLTLLSTYNTQTQGGPAINSGNSSITGILYAPYGTVILANNTTFKEVVAQKIEMGNGTILTYDQGLISTFFSSGPSGSFSLIKGTYQIK